MIPSQSLRKTFQWVSNVSSPASSADLFLTALKYKENRGQNSFYQNCKGVEFIFMARISTLGLYIYIYAISKSIQICRTRKKSIRVNILTRNPNFFPDRHFGHILFLPWFCRTTCRTHILIAKMTRERHIAPKFNDLWT